MGRNPLYFRENATVACVVGRRNGRDKGNWTHAKCIWRAYSLCDKHNEGEGRGEFG